MRSVAGNGADSTYWSIACIAALKQLYAQRKTAGSMTKVRVFACPTHVFSVQVDYGPYIRLRTNEKYDFCRRSKRSSGGHNSSSYITKDIRISLVYDRKTRLYIRKYPRTTYRYAGVVVCCFCYVCPVCRKFPSLHKTYRTFAPPRG